jgi:hypothetical protein
MIGFAMQLSRRKKGGKHKIFSGWRRRMEPK